jgi:toxin ParE1/3/4
MPKAIVPRELTKQGGNEAGDYYLSENAPEAALHFVDALERAYSHISCRPGAGSAKYAYELNLPCLCFWPLQKYPHLAFDVERDLPDRC